MKKPEISVVMPTFNTEIYIARAIESILRQTFKNFELIIIDDKSTDSTLDIVKIFSKIDKRIRIIKNNKNFQIAYSLNKGVKNAKGKFIARMDADDISYPDRLELQYKLLEKFPKVGIVGANMFIINDQGKIISKREYPIKSNNLKKVMFRYSPFGHPTVMFRKRAFDEFGGYDLTKVPCEDIDLWFKIGSKYEFATVPKYLLGYTQLSSSNSHKRLKFVELLGFKIKIDAIKKYTYRPNLYDILYNLGQFITLWFMPPKLRIWLYDYLRSRKII